jgi:hypothetical protein
MAIKIITPNKYVNGVLETISASGTMSITNDKIGIGSIGAGNALFFNGLIDEVRIYSRALTQAEITILYQSY